MTKWILTIALAVLAVALAGPTSGAHASPARPTLESAAATLHSEEGIEGGGESISGCHPGSRDNIVVCAVSLTGLVNGPEGPTEAVCSTAIAAVWGRQQVNVSGIAGATGTLGGWTVHLVSEVRCEGSPVH
jgi:hypothetical protein